MTSEKDVALVAGYASAALAGATHKLDIVVPLINEQLIYIQIQAAVADAQGLRDQLQELCQELGRYSY
jgi:hypothetical protein